MGFQVSKVVYLSYSSSYHILIKGASVSFSLGGFQVWSFKSFVYVKFCFSIIRVDFYFFSWIHWFLFCVYTVIFIKICTKFCFFFLSESGEKLQQQIINQVLSCFLLLNFSCRRIVAVKVENFRGHNINYVGVLMTMYQTNAWLCRYVEFIKAAIILI